MTEGNDGMKNEFKQVDNGLPNTELLDAITTSALTGAPLPVIERGELRYALGKVNSLEKDVALPEGALEKLRGEFLGKFSADKEAVDLINQSFDGERL